MILDKNELEIAKELYKRVVELYRQKVELEVLKKERIENLQAEIAQICEVKNKNGEILPNKVKMPLVIAILSELFMEKTNAKELEYELMQEYKKAIKKELSNAVITAFVSVENELKENTANIKEVNKEYVMLNKETLDAINQLAKEKYKEMKNDKFGIDEKEVNAETEAIKAELSEYLSKWKFLNLFAY